MSGVAITKVELSPQTVYCGDEIIISAYVFEICEGAGERRLPVRLREKENADE